MSSFQAIYDIAEICAQRGASQAILCPGSRCAPLTIAFARHTKITSRTISDERSAAFIALGIAQQVHAPTILVCTSGSAALNFAPAVAEAWYSHTPLVIFTADRPAEWIDQMDGQAIRQANIYRCHVKQSYTLPQEYDHPDSWWHVNRIVNEGISLAMEYPQGPVHINAPFREPFYPKQNEKITFSGSVRIIKAVPTAQSLSEADVRQLKESLRSFSKVLIVVGQGGYDEKLIRAAEKFIKLQHPAIVGEIVSNFHSLSNSIKHADSFLGQLNDDLKKSLRPELLITFGRTVLSKNLKLFLRQQRPAQHWHIQAAGEPADTFQSITKVIRTSPAVFFNLFEVTQKKQSKFESQKRYNYTTLWSAQDHRARRVTRSRFKIPALTELYVVAEVLRTLPKRCNLHLANSMSVRYANLIGLSVKKGIRVFANRGTSGIDGCTSTAVGHSLTSDVPNFLITGDVAFFYDRNAFWHNYPIPNLRIILLNNHGGIIFSLIDGPASLPEKDEYFVTDQKLTAQSLAAEFELGYTRIDSIKKLTNALRDFYEFSGTPKIIEFETSREVNQKVFDGFKNEIRKSNETT